MDMSSPKRPYNPASSIGFPRPAEACRTASGISTSMTGLKPWPARSSFLKATDIGTRTGEAPKGFKRDGKGRTEALHPAWLPAYRQALIALKTVKIPLPVPSCTS